MNKNSKKYLLSAAFAFGMFLQGSSSSSWEPRLRNSLMNHDFYQINPSRQTKRINKKEDTANDFTQKGKSETPLEVKEIIHEKEKSEVKSIDEKEINKLISDQTKNFLSGQSGLNETDNEDELLSEGGDLMDAKDYDKNSKPFSSIKKFFSLRKDYLKFKKVLKNLNLQIVVGLFKSKMDEPEGPYLSFLNRNDLFHQFVEADFSIADIIKKRISNWGTKKAMPIEGLSRSPELEKALDSLITESLVKVMDKFENFLKNKNPNYKVNGVPLSEVYELFFGVSEMQFNNMIQYQ